MSTTAQTPTSLAQFQDAFAAALFDPHDARAASLATLTHQPGFAVYRNTVLAACVDALEANYPAVARIVGREWLRAAAAVFARQHLPPTPMLVLYGAQFADFLSGFAPAAEFVYLPAVARVDRLWSESHTAADATPLAAASLASIAPDALGALRLAPHPAAGWVFDTNWPVFTLWSRNREDSAVFGDLQWHGEGVLLTRPGDTVQWRALSVGGCHFLQACATEQPIAAAAAAALAAEPDIDLTALIATLLLAGAFATQD